VARRAVAVVCNDCVPSRVERRAGGAMTDDGVWMPLTQREEDGVWERLFAELHFPMGSRAGKEQTPSLTYAIGYVFEEDITVRDALEDDLDQKTLAALRRCISQDQRLYALDWQHQSYWFYPHRFSDASSWAAWKVPVLPDGDFYVFLAEDFSFCLFGDCINFTICVFGQALLDAFAHDRPILLEHVVRVNGELPNRQEI